MRFECKIKIKNALLNFFSLRFVRDTPTQNFDEIIHQYAQQLTDLQEVAINMAAKARYTVEVSLSGYTHTQRLCHRNLFKHSSYTKFVSFLFPSFSLGGEV